MRSVTRQDSCLEMPFAKQKQTIKDKHQHGLRRGLLSLGYTVLPSSSLWKRSFPNAETFSSCSFLRCTSTSPDVAKGSQHNATAPRGSRRSSERSADLCVHSRRPRHGSRNFFEAYGDHVVKAWSNRALVQNQTPMRKARASLPVVSCPLQKPRRTRPRKHLANGSSKFKDPSFLAASQLHTEKIPERIIFFSACFTCDASKM